MSKIGFLFLAGLLLIACTSDKDELIGKWDNNIHLSTNSVEFGSGADSVTITTKGAWWFINSIVLDGVTYQYFDSEEVDIVQDSYLIEEDDFSFERKNNTTMVISLKENNSKASRHMSITLQAGNYFDYLYIYQVAQ